LTRRQVSRPGQHTDDWITVDAALAIPIDSIFAWTRGLRHRGTFDNTPDESTPSKPAT
jgi:hypothetical protein